MLCTVAPLVLGRYLIEMAASPSLMLVLQEKVVEVAHPHIENFVILVVVVAVVAAELAAAVVADLWKRLCKLLASGFCSAPKMSLLGKGLQIFCMIC